jgi:aerobic-type carbon monoxide dehydrogenase small subunit (CoxS/CutS family)
VSTEKKPENEAREELHEGGLSRRQFLKDAGLVVGGATVGSMAILSACGETKTVTNTSTITNTSTVTSTVGAGSTVTTTVTAGGVTKYVCPVDGQEFATQAALNAHFAANHPGATLPDLVALKVNGVTYPMTVDPNWSLAFVIREKLGLTGTKMGCDRGECGTCTVHMDGVPVLACMVLACEATGHEFVTIEGLANGATLHPVQKLFFDNASYQCGFCTPGNIMTTVALYAKTPKPTRAQAREALSGNLCWCIDYTRTLNTVVKGVS